MKNKKSLAIGVALISVFTVSGYAFGNNKEGEHLYYPLLNKIEINKTYDRNQLFKESFIDFINSDDFKNIDLTVEEFEILNIFDSLKDDFVDFKHILKVDEYLWQTYFAVDKYSKEEIENLLDKINTSRQEKDRLFSELNTTISKLKEDLITDEANKILSSIEKILLNCNKLYYEIEKIALEHKSNLDNSITQKEDASARDVYVEIMKEFESLSSYVNSIKIPKSNQNFSIDDLNIAKIEILKVSLLEKINSEIELTEKEELMVVIMRSEVVIKTFEELTKDLSKELVNYYQTEDNSVLKNIKDKIDEELDIINQDKNTLQYQSSKKLLCALESYVSNQVDFLEKTLNELPRKKIHTISNKEYCEAIAKNYKKVEGELEIFDEILKSTILKTF